MKSRYWFEAYRDKAGKFRWRLKARNGRIIADSGQGYTQYASVKRATLLVTDVLSDFSDHYFIDEYTRDRRNING